MPKPLNMPKEEGLPAVLGDLQSDPVQHLRDPFHLQKGYIRRWGTLRVALSSGKNIRDRRPISGSGFVNSGSSRFVIHDSRYTIFEMICQMT
jgi:hypothetical protein